MPIKKCDKCKGSGFLGISYEISKIDEEVNIEKLELNKCDKCKNGFVYIVDDSSYDKNQISN